MASLLLLLLLSLPPSATPGESGPSPGGTGAATLRDHRPESHTSTHTANLTLGQDQGNVTAAASKEMLVQTLRKSLVFANDPEAFTSQTETSDAGGREESSRRTHDPSTRWGPERAAALTPESSTWASAGTEMLKGLPTLQSSSTRQAESMSVTHTIYNIWPALQSLTVSVGPPGEKERFSGVSDLATVTYAAASSSPLEAESGRKDTLQDPGEGVFPKSEFALLSSKLPEGFQPNDSPASSEHPLAHNSSTETRSLPEQTEMVSRSMQSTQEEKSTAQWFGADKTSTDMTGNSTSFPEAVNTSNFTHFSALAPKSGTSGLALRKSHYSKPSTSSSESLEISAPHATAYNSELEFRSVVEKGTAEGTPGAVAHDLHTLATLTGNGERTLRSLTNWSAAASPDLGHSEAMPQHSESTTPQENATAISIARLGSRVLGVTGINQDTRSGSDLEQRTDDHTYVSSTFTKGERALLSITENSSASALRASATFSVHESGPSRSHHLSSSGVLSEGTKAIISDEEHMKLSATSLVPHTAHIPSVSPTVNMSNVVLLGSEVASVGDPSFPPSSSGPPLPLPSVSQPQQPLPLTRASTPLLHPTPGTPTPLSSLPPSSPVAPSTWTSTSHAIFPTTAALPRTSVQMATIASSEVTLPSNHTINTKNPSQVDHETVITNSEVSLESLPTEAPNAGTLNSTSGILGPAILTKAYTDPELPATSIRLAQTSPTVITTTLQSLPPLEPTSSYATSTAAASPTTVQPEAEKLSTTSPGIFLPLTTTEGPITTQRSPVHTQAVPGPIPQSSVSTPAKEATPEPGITEEYSHTSHFLTFSPDSHTLEISTAEVLTPTAQHNTQSPRASLSPATENICASNPCLHGGRCIEDPLGRGYRCVCSPSWQGDNCSVDVNECLSNPCPSLAVCNNTQGSFMCKCPVGYQLEKGICSLVRTFVAELKIKKTLLNATVELHEVENKITRMLNICFSPLSGYMKSTVHASREFSTMTVALQTTFSLAANVTLFDLADKVQRCTNSCRASADLCHLLGSQRRVFRVGSLCRRKTPECDRETSLCTDVDGIARCQCKLGYFQFNKMDHSCRACEDGYRLENKTCMSCPFGLGGLNCGNPYQLITVVIAAAGGGLLLILGIALIVTCCRKNKNDISKLIFKSGDFQMSPYAEYPKNPRSQEWGREAIEMHENGSTKNLLQMTDVYYSPTSVRNPELERNGLYPAYTGLPGSRHSCIFPGQYNPSFISDESRRRDYF